VSRAESLFAGFVRPVTIGPNAADSGFSGYSDDQLDALYKWWDLAVRNLNDVAWANDIYNLTSRGGWKRMRYGLNLTVLEGIVQASRQVYRDSWYQTLTPQQRALRPLLVGLEAMGTDVVAGVAGRNFGAAGLAVGGPPGAFGGYLAGNAATTRSMEGMWTTWFNPMFASELGVWP
jgi:hypothetical protein